jgi:alkanesulfonate monooxygenase SsuD/methylene tetrahydromethanopterin reductase-like flavin-dependent oxidoreductase (luciferase family)
MRFGIFDHLDDSGLPLNQHFEERLKLIEAYDRAGFYGYHLAEHHNTRSATRRRPASSCRRSRSGPGSSGSGRWCIYCRSITRCV